MIPHVCVCVRAHTRARTCVSSSHNSAVLTWCVFVVMNFEKIMEFWLAHSKNLKKEHNTYKQLLEELTGELVNLTPSFAQHVQWRNRSGYVLKYPGTKKTRDGRRHPKTALEQLSSTEDSDDVEEETESGATVEGRAQAEGSGTGATPNSLPSWITLAWGAALLRHSIQSLSVP